MLEELEALEVSRPVSLVSQYLNLHDVSTEVDIHPMRALEIVADMGYDTSSWSNEQFQAFIEEWSAVNLLVKGISPERLDEGIVVNHFCGFCHTVYRWSAEDISSHYEASPFMPCGCSWTFLNKYVK